MRFWEKDISVQKFPARKQIDEVLHQTPDEKLFLNNLPKLNIEVLKSAIYKNYCCYDLVFGEKGSFDTFWENLPLIARFTEQKEGAIIIYFENNFSIDENIKHVGWIEQDTNKVISKWGQLANIYRHDYWNVPSVYGNRITCIEDVWN